MGSNSQTRQSPEREFLRFAELAGLPIWVACTTSKVPINPHTGNAGSASDPATWGTRSEAEAAVAKYGLAGIGIALTTLSDGRRLCGLDTDGCYGATDDGRAGWVDDAHALLHGCYNELSPSSTGRHHLFLIDPATLPDGAGERSDYSNRKKKPERHGFEVYLTGGRYFTVTGLDAGGELMVLGPPTIVQLINLLDTAFPLPEKEPPPKPNGHQARRDHASDNDKTFEILDHLPNTGSYADYRAWFRIVGAVYSATDGSEAGLRAVEAWTERGGYANGHCAELWRYFRRAPPRNLDIRHMINEARAHGYEPYPPRNGTNRQPPRGNGGERGKRGRKRREQEPIAEANFATEVERLAKLDALGYERERRAEANRLGVGVTFLDNAVAARRDPGSSDGLPEIEPSPEPVEGVELLNELAGTIKRHVGVPTRGEDAIALWIMHSHCLDAAQHSSRLGITSAAPECGKSTLLRIVGDLVPRKLAASNITAAATFRAIEKWRPTLLVDEADTFLRDNDELRGVLNAGHSRAEAYVVRTVGDNHEPKRFGCWCSVAIAMIGKLPDTLASRAIHIDLQRLPKSQCVEPYRQHKRPYADLARRCARWAQDNIEALRDAEPDMPEGITNRRADNWRPLFAISDLIGGHWSGISGKAREAALTLDHVDAGQTTAIMLLEDMRTLIGNADRVASATLARRLAEMEGRPWPEFGRAQKPITANAIARLLKPFNVFPRDIRDRDTDLSCKGYLASDLTEAWSRYL